MIRTMGSTASGFRPRLDNRAESLSLESLEIRCGNSEHESRLGRPASGFRPKFHNRGQCLSLESPNILPGKSSPLIFFQTSVKLLAIFFVDFASPKFSEILFVMLFVFLCCYDRWFNCYFVKKNFVAS